MTYSMLKGLLRTVLTAQGLTESNNFDITEDGAIIQSDGFAIVLAGMRVADRYTGKARNIETRYELHVSKSYRPDAYADADDVAGELVDDVLAGIEEISVATQQANGIIGILTDSATAQHFEQGVVHVTIPVTVTYRRTA